ncbi:MAG: amino acid transporter [Haloquadratum walsbyi J07HQW1]|uniref:Amino acid transporter n=1 Tax=Haloquadratum walsbyi J07HQW1 TaxID=1238424 RepID=U1MRG3_9EURY|nr:MAG: amino acid transporter [Haloquadratum walsbyi J07HQW1]
MSDDTELAKDLGPLAALTIGVGTMVGAGIFVLPGPAVAQAGPLAVGAFALGGIIALFTALSASELGTAMPRSGGAYYYINHALGPLFGSIAGWGNWMGLAFASAFYMTGFGEYITTFLPVPSVNLAFGGQVSCACWCRVIYFYQLYWCKRDRSTSEYNCNYAYKHSCRVYLYRTSQCRYLKGSTSRSTRSWSKPTVAGDRTHLRFISRVCPDHIRG